MNTTREEDKELLSNLIFANKKFAENLEELQKLDGLAARAAALNEIDTQKIMEKLSHVNFAVVANKISTNLNEQLESSRAEIVKSTQSVVAAAKELSQSTILMKESSDSLMQIDAMSDHLQDVAGGIKHWRLKSIYGAIALSLFFGLSSGVVVSNIHLFLPEQTIQNADILTAKFGKIGVMQHDVDPNIFYFVFGAQELNAGVQTMERDGKRYLMFRKNIKK